MLEGVRLCCDALRSNREVISVYATADCQEKYFDEINLLKENCVGFYTVSNDVMKIISDTVTPQGVVCTVKIKENTFSYKKGKKYIALDTIQNPDNLGAMARTAEALGIDGMIVSGGCDIYNPKALRASMGSLLRIPVKTHTDLASELEKCEKSGIKTYAAVPDSNAVSVTDADFTDGAVCVIGNEGNGVSEDIIKKCSESITIKMTGNAESLNAASAASIIMWELVK